MYTYSPRASCFCVTYCSGQYGALDNITLCIFHFQVGTYDICTYIISIYTICISHKNNVYII